MLKKLALATFAATAFIAATLYLTERTVLRHLAVATIGSTVLMVAVPSTKAGGKA